MSTFSAGSVTVQFDAQTDSFDESRPARVAIQDIPGGDTFYVDQAGRGPLRWNVRMLLPNATAWGQLTSVLGEAGTLAVDTLDSHAVVLLNVSRSAPHVDGTMLATAEFVITDV